MFPPAAFGDAHGNADQQEQRTNNRRRARDLHGLTLPLDPVDRVEQRAGANEVDALHVGHVDDDKIAPVREIGERVHVLRIGARHHA